jgi:NAD(P) transhydrogenase subunit beta
MANLVAFGYLIAAVCFVLALRGLSSPATSQQGNRIGIAGMAIAVVVTLFALPDPGWGSYVLIIVGLAIGGTLGAIIARRIEMTAMPQLVAAFHSLVGLAAVLVAAAALYDPAAYGITRPDGGIRTMNLIEMGLGTVIGAVTFTGSIIAFAKLQALMRSAPIMLPGRHLINIGIGAAIVLLLILFATSESAWAFWPMTLLALANKGSCG